MFKLLKLAAYVALGYFIYELYQGMNAQPAQGQQPAGGKQSQPGRQRQASRQQKSQQDQGSDQPAASQQQGGKRATAHDSSGATTSHTVGRGVVHR